jgi:acyl carrier protein
VIRQRLSRRLRIPADAVQPSSRFVEDLAVDSLTVIELLIELEDRYDVVITDEEARDLSTVAEAAEFVAMRIAARG